MEKKNKRLQLIYLLYWIMLAYILAALIWWFIELNSQTHEMASILARGIASNKRIITDPENWEKRKAAQYLGEGITFLLLLIAGAILFFRAIRKQFKISQQQQNFMMAITHELKTPIAVSKLNLETIQKRNLDETQRKRLMNNTLEELARMNTLSNNLLLSSQIEAGGYRLAMETIHLGQLIRDRVNSFKERYPERNIFFQIEEEDMPVRVDHFLMEMLVNNLIDNAIKYSPKEGIIQIDLIRDRNDIKLTVADGGNGIPDSDKKRIFKKFYRTGNTATREAKGTGLGLFLVKKITETHNGSIHILDNTPTGSLFTLKFPAAE